MSKSKQAEHLWCRPLAYSWHSISPTTLVWSMAPLWKSCVWNGASHAWRVFSGPERANTFQYISILCFWMLLDAWDSHGMNETWIIYDYMVISGRVMFPKPCVLPFWTQKSTVACNVMTRMSSQNDSASPQERRSPNSQPKGTLDSTGFWDTQFLRRSQK